MCYLTVFVMKYSMNFALGPINTQYQMSAVEQAVLLLLLLRCTALPGRQTNDLAQEVQTVLQSYAFLQPSQTFCLSGIKKKGDATLQQFCTAAKVSTGHSEPRHWAIEGISLFLFNLACAGVGVGTLLIALTVRILVTYVCVLFAGFNVREKVFIALAWMPKATVQVRLCWRRHIFSTAFLVLKVRKCANAVVPSSCRRRLAPRLWTWPLPARTRRWRSTAWTCWRWPCWPSCSLLRWGLLS